MIHELGEEIQALRESAKRFAAAEIAPQAEAMEEAGAVPRELWRKMGALGLLGVTVGEEYGGAGMGYLAHCVAMEEISRASASAGLSYGAHSNLCVNQIWRNGNEKQKREHLPKLTSGEHVGALAMSEPEAGSDVVAMRTTAEKSANGYILNGEKMWITNAPDADVVVVYAKTAPEKKQRGITAFIVQNGAGGFSRGEKISKLGMRGSATGALHFNNCEVPEKNILGEPGGGAKVLMSGLDLERVVLAAGPLGILAACLELSSAYAKERKQFGRAISEFQLVRAKIADMQTVLSAARSYVYAVAAACDRGEFSRADCAGAILFSSEAATRAALDAVQILGANGYASEYPAGRFLRDAKLYEIGAGTSEIRRMLIARELLGGEL